MGTDKCRRVRLFIGSLPGYCGHRKAIVTAVLGLLRASLHPRRLEKVTYYMSCSKVLFFFYRIFICSEMGTF